MFNSWALLCDELYGDSKMLESHPDNIILSNPSKMFEYEKIARQIDECDDIAELQMNLKSMVKLYMKQLEVTVITLKM
jgi:hypothetical protein